MKARVVTTFTNPHTLMDAVEPLARELPLAGFRLSYRAA